MLGEAHDIGVISSASVASKSVIYPLFPFWVKCS